MARKPVLVLVFLLIVGGTPAALAVTPGELVDPRPRSCVLDRAGALSAEVEAELDRLGKRVEAETGAELAVVVIDTTGGSDPRAFAVELFNRWRLGDARENDGMLVFAALEDRAAEIVLGDGLDSTQNRGLSDRVMQATMVPLFRRGDPQAAVLEGARASATQILGLTAGGAEAPPPAARAQAPPVQSAVHQPAAEPSSPRPKPQATSPGAAKAGEALAGCSCLVAAVAAVLAFLYLLRRLLRPRPRKCPKCKTAMVKLDEASDDMRLEEGEKAEERVGSADWQMWCCPACSYAEKTRKVSFFTRFKPCPQCGHATLDITSDMVERPTHYSEGLVQVREACHHCGYATSSSQVVPRLVQAQRLVEVERPRSRVTGSGSVTEEPPQSLFSSGSSRSSSSSGSSSSSKSSSSSSSSSSGKSSGGGHSSGGGASGKW